jgi:hypothetical protein
LTQRGRQRKQTKTIVYRSRKASLNSMGAAERTEETIMAHRFKDFDWAHLEKVANWRS